MRLIDADQFGVVSFQGKSEDFIEGALFILDKIYEAPTIEQRPHGEWIVQRNKQGTHIYSVCSKCNVPYLETDFPNFCPNCGALMISSNSEIEKSKSEIVPDYRDGWRLRGGEAE